ncbi:MAG: polysaccharide deacetylase family protein [Fibrobacteria bacterium]
MLKFGKSLLCLAAICICPTAPRAAAVVDTPYTVGTWQGFRPAALSMTFDDGLPNQYTTLLNLLNQYGYKATYFVDMGNRKRFNIPWDDIRKAAASGHEIASHTVTHPHLGDLSVTEQEKELKDCKDTLEREIPTQKVLTMAYPFCSAGNDAAVAKYYLAARKCDKRFEPADPANFMGLSSFSWSNDVAASSLNSNVESAISKKAWTTYLIHGIDAGGYTPVKSSMLKEHFDFLRTKENQIWIATFADVARYIRERQTLTLKQVRSTKDSLVLKATITLPNTPYNVPLSFQRPLPDGWNTCFASQNGRALKDSLLTVNSKRMIMFDAIPDGSDIVLSSSGVVALHSAPGGIAGKVALSNAQGKLRFSLPAGLAGKLELSLYDYQGGRRAVVTAMHADDGYHVDLPKIGSGVYGAKLSLNGVLFGESFRLRL